MDKDELMWIVGNNLQQIRAERGYTQEQLSEKAGISTSFYANLERGKKGMSIFVLRNLADSLDTSVDQLMYQRNADARIRNIEMLLSDMPESFVRSVERLVLLCVEEFSDAAPTGK